MMATKFLENPPALPVGINRFRAIMPHAPSSFLIPLELAMARYQINTPGRAAGFISQIAFESNQLRHLSEVAQRNKLFNPGIRSRSAIVAKTDREYFEHFYGSRAGNTTEEDGYTYRGRGAIQITGKKLYESIGKGINVDLVKFPDLLETDAETDMLACAYFFARFTRGLLAAADSVVPTEEFSIIVTNLRLTRGVNGGINGLYPRLRYYRHALAQFYRSVLIPGAGAVPNFSTDPIMDRYVRTLG